MARPFPPNSSDDTSISCRTEPGSAAHSAACSPLAQATPDLRSSEQLDDPLADSRQAVYVAALPCEGAVVVRRRVAPTEPVASSKSTVRQARFFVCQLATDLGHKSGGGIVKGFQAMQKAGFDLALMDEVLAHQRLYRKVMKTLAGGKQRASVAQHAQALALSVFDINRCVFDLASLPQDPDDALSLLPGGFENPSLRMLVLGSTQITDFTDLREMVELWDKLHVDPANVYGDTSYRYLVNDLGLFHRNALRVLDAFGEARTAQPGQAMQRMPACLAAQWLKVPSERELEAQRHIPAERMEQFQRKLSRQFALICMSFGLPVPQATELVLLDFPV